MNYTRILVFGAHPDDEIRMAGTMAKLSVQGVQVVVVTFTNGCEGYPRPEMRDQIVALRRKEMAACDKVLGIARRVTFDIPDMGLVNSKETLKRCIQVIREVRPEAIFTHGPVDRHRDHLATHDLSVEATWHAGQPVATELGPPWKTPHLLYYKATEGLKLPCVVFDVTETAHKHLEALATQESQHRLFGRTKAQLLEEAQRVKEADGCHTERFWMTDRTELSDFPHIS